MGLQLLGVPVLVVEVPLQWGGGGGVGGGVYMVAREQDPLVVLVRFIYSNFYVKSVPSSMSMAKRQSMKVAEEEPAKEASPYVNDVLLNKLINLLVTGEHSSSLLIEVT